MMKYSTATLLALTGCVSAMDINNNPLVTRSNTIGQSSDALEACRDLPGSTVTCGSHCWPNCDSDTGNGHPDMMAFNHYIVIPEGRSCYVDTYSYGRFDAFLSKSSVLNVTLDTSVYQDGVCLLDQEQVPLQTGALTGDHYCQIYMKVEMGDCDGCPDYQRRIEVYSNSFKGCPADEFVIEQVEPEPEVDPEVVDPEEEPEDTDQEETETVTPVPEDTSSVYLKVTSALVSTMAVLMIEI